MLVSVVTKNLAVRNPISNYNTNINEFVVKYYNWANNTNEPSITPRSNDYYAYLIIDNLNSAGITYNENPSGYRPDTFTWIRYPHQRYYLDTPYSSLVHRAPF